MEVEAAHDGDANAVCDGDDGCQDVVADFIYILYIYFYKPREMMTKSKMSA